MTATEWDIDGDEATTIGEALEDCSLWEAYPAGKDEEEEEDEDEDDEDLDDDEEEGDEDLDDDDD